MRSSLASLGLLAVIGGLGAACGSVAAQSDGSMAGSGGGGSGGAGTTGGGGTAVNDGGVDAAPPTVAEACAQFGTAFCGRLQACAPYVGQILYGDRATCEARAALGCMLDFEVPDTNHTTTDMVACAHDAAGARCEDLLVNNLPTSCLIKPGARRNGANCASSWQCMSTHCERTTGDCGVCAPRAGATGACTVDEGCTMGLVCAAQKCVAPGALNAACGVPAPCRADLYCSAVSKTCATPLGPGGSCDGDSNACDFRQGVACNGFASPPRCETVAAAKGGESCGIVNNTLTLCVVLNSCNGISLVPLQTMGTCPNPAGDGQQCNDNVHCMAPANCVGGLCRLPSTAACN